MFCQNCGKEITDGAAFCANCGTPVNAQPVQPPVDPEPVEQPVYQQPVQQPVYQQPVSAPSFNSTDLVAKIKNGAWFELSLALIFLLEFILGFCKVLYCKLGDEKECGTIAEQMDSSALTVFVAIFSFIAFVVFAYLLCKKLFGFQLSVLDPQWDLYLMASGVVAAIFDFIAILVANGKLQDDIKQLRQLASMFGADSSVKAGLSFGGVLFLILSIVAIGLLGYQAYKIFYKKPIPVEP